MNRKLRILMISARFFPYSGGTEVHTREVSRRLARMGHHVTVLTTDPSRKLARYERLDDFDVRRVPAWPSESDLHFAPALPAHVARGQWDVVHVQGYHTLVPPLAMLGALGAKVPYVVTFHGGGHSSRMRQSVRGTQRRLLSPLLRRAARLIALAEFELELFGDQLGIPRSKFVIIPTGTDLPKVDLPPRAPQREPLIASIGRLERYKGHHRVIAALPWILKEEPDARLWVAGSGPYEPELHELANRLGVAARVDIHAIPSTDRQAMARELSRVGVVTLMSEYETQPAAVLEGLAMGCPAVVADTSGLSELARRGLAHAIPLDSSPGEVAQAIINQLRNPQVPTDLRLPTWEDCTQQLEALYIQVARA
jgi:glycosyltransferase involved in cell wall biosynthesis